MDDKSSHSDKTTAIKEIHNIEKTKVLLLRDLPFITRLSKFYDLTLFNNSLSDKSDSYSMDNKQKPIPKLIAKEHNDGYESFENQFDNIDVNKALEILTDSKLDMDNNTKLCKYNKIDDPIIEEMHRQFNFIDSLNDDL
jgi:hypothetical protein